MQLPGAAVSAMPNGSMLALHEEGTTPPYGYNDGGIASTRHDTGFRGSSDPFVDPFGGVIVRPPVLGSGCGPALGVGSDRVIGRGCGAG